MKKIISLSSPKVPSYQDLNSQMKKCDLQADKIQRIYKEKTKKGHNSGKKIRK